MCGIVGYLGPKQAYPILIDGLTRLEYRGYDSAGIATLEEGGKLRVEKKEGKVANLEAHVAEDIPKGTVGIGHTRWATHGPPSDRNAHPHAGSKGRIAVIHNGIIENYESLKELLSDRGHTLVSDTDTEVLAHFIEEVMTSTGLDLPEAVRIALKEVVGAYAIVVLDQSQPDRLVAARKASPLVIGVGGNNDFFVGSDATPIVAHTKNVVYLEDEEVATMTRDGKLSIRTIGDADVTPEIQALELEIASLEKGGYEHFMLKEIYEQPRSIRDSIRGRVNLQRGTTTMSGIDENWLSGKRLNASSSWVAEPAGTQGWWLNTSSKVWPASLWKWNTPLNFAIGTPSSATPTSCWPFPKAEKRQTPWPPSALPKMRVPTSLGCATWWGPASRGRPTREPTHTLVQRLGWPAPRPSLHKSPS